VQNEINEEYLDQTKWKMETTMNGPLFSIIVPTKDRADLLKSCISSIVNLDYINFECLIIDDGSSDDTRQVVDSFHDDRIKYHFKKFSDRSKVRNFGLDNALGTHICFVDDDDWLEQDHLTVFVNEISKDPDNLQVLRVGYKMHTQEKIKKSSVFNDSYQNPIDFIFKKMCGVWSLCIPKDFTESIRFPVGFPHWQDTYFIALLLAEHPFKQLDAYTYNYRVHDKMGSLKVVTEKQLKERAEINVEAIQHFKLNHFDKVSKQVSSKLFDFLVAEKYIQYAALARSSGYPKLSKVLMKRSLRSGFKLTLWKYYVQCFITLN
jgi:glycosyltransferase involved in cell wall biosynthesis